MGWIEDLIRGICGYLYLCGGFVAGGELVGSVAGSAIVGVSLVSRESIVIILRLRVHGQPSVLPYVRFWGL